MEYGELPSYGVIFFSINMIRPVDSLIGEYGGNVNANANGSARYLHRYTLTPYAVLRVGCMYSIPR